MLPLSLKSSSELFQQTKQKKRPEDLFKSMDSPCSATVKKNPFQYIYFSTCEPGFHALVMEYFCQYRLKDFLIAFLVFQNNFVASQLFTVQVQSNSFVIKVVGNKQMQTLKCKEM